MNLLDLPKNCRQKGLAPVIFSNKSLTSAKLKRQFSTMILESFLSLNLQNSFSLKLEYLLLVKCCATRRLGKRLVKVSKAFCISFSLAKSKVIFSTVALNVGLNKSNNKSSFLICNSKKDFQSIESCIVSCITSLFFFYFLI